MSETFTLLVYAVLAAASPVTLIATLVVLGTADARRNGIAFAAGFILGQAAGLGIPLIVGLSVTSSSGENSNVSASFELAVGLLMLLAASRMFRKRAEPIPDESRAAVLLVRLERVNSQDRLLVRGAARHRGQAAADRDPGRVDDRAGRGSAVPRSSSRPRST